MTNMTKNIFDLKKQMRLLIRQKRNLLTPLEQRTTAMAIKNIVSQLQFFTEAVTISGYLAFDGEVDLNPVLELALSHEKQCYLPVLNQTSPNDKTMSFAPYVPTTRLHLNKLGITEPFMDTISSRKLIQPQNLDVMLIPLIAFDRSGNRLGIGGGYFDATLKDLRLANKLQNKPKLIGVAHAFQEVASVPTDVWDVALDGILTEDSFIAI
jgi:5-formyltetrahydrofolate cyclo-ligase